MNQKLFCASLILFLCLNLISAQTEKGNFLVGISAPLNLTGDSQVGFVSQKRKGDGFETDPQKTFSITLAPRGGYFVIDGLAVGLDLNLGYAKITDDFFSGGEFSVTQVLVTPFARFYLPSGNVKPFFECTGGIGSSKSKFDDDSFNSENTSNLFLLGAGFGIASQLGNKVTFDTSLGYSHLSEKDKEDNPANERLITNAVRLNLGFSIYLN